MTDELKQAVERKQQQMNSPEGKSERIRKLLFDNQPQPQQPQRDMEAEHAELLERVPEWRDTDLKNAECNILKQKMAMEGWTQEEIDSIGVEQAVRYRETAIKQASQARLDAKADAAVKQGGSVEDQMRRIVFGD